MSVTDLGVLKSLSLRTVWTHEALDFTPWLAANIGGLGEALGLDLELERQEANVGEFSLDLLAKDLSSGKHVIVENQLTATDHDHLGKLLTYAAGFNAAVVVWIAESIREEHRQALDWLNQRTDNDTEFFGVIVEVLQIDHSKPAYRFRPVVFPNEWQKSKRKPVTIGSTRGEAYRQYFQPLIDELREKHKFTGARAAQAQNWYAFSSGVSGVQVSAVFAGNNIARVELYIDMGDSDENKALFDWLVARKDAIEARCGFALQWEPLEGKRASRISFSRPGSIGSAPVELVEIRKWHVQNLLIFRNAFAPLLKQWRSGNGDHGAPGVVTMTAAV